MKNTSTEIAVAQDCIGSTNKSGGFDIFSETEKLRYQKKTKESGVGWPVQTRGFGGVNL